MGLEMCPDEKVGLQSLGGGPVQWIRLGWVKLSGLWQNDLSGMQDQVGTSQVRKET